MWKVRKRRRGPAAGVRGDYEDPDRSAWEDDFEEEDVNFQEEAGDEPAGLQASAIWKNQKRKRGSPTRRSLFCSEGATQVLVARR
jgi:hypothetical protein